MSSMNFPDPNVTPEYKDWVWDGEKWVKDCPASGGDAGGSGGAGMVISDTEPADKVTGMQWLEAGTSKVWIWDDDKWLRFPAADGLTEGGGGGGGSEWELIEAVDLGGASAYEFYGFELGVKQYRLSIPFAYSPTDYRYRISLYEDMQDCVSDLGKRYTETRMWPDASQAINSSGQTIDIPWRSGMSGDSRSEVIFSGMHDTSTNRNIRVTYENWQGENYTNTGYFVAPDSGKQFNGFRLYMAKGPAPTVGEARVYKLKEA